MIDRVQEENNLKKQLSVTAVLGSYLTSVAGTVIVWLVMWLATE
jgi:hypothetical protein